MGYSASKVLAPQRIMGVVKRVQSGRQSLARLLGFVGEEPNVVRPGGRHFSYDVFNGTRQLPRGIAPDGPRRLAPPQAVGNVTGTFPRLGETVPLLYEQMLNQRMLGGPSCELDQMGLSYIGRQEAYQAEKFLNFIEFQTAAMLRGKYYFAPAADQSYLHSWEPTGLPGEQLVDFRIPAGNRGQLNMLGDGEIVDASWDSQDGEGNYDADIPQQIFGINAALEALCGLPLEHLCMNSVTWNLMIKNQQIKSQAGIGNMPMQKIERTAGGHFTGLISSVPWVTIHIMDHVLEIEGPAGTFKQTKALADDHVYGMPSPSPAWVALGEGSEVVVEGNSPEAITAERHGQYAWATPSDNPAGYDLHQVYNGLPFLYVPGAIVDAEVVFES
ncbi:hypothetical protein [Bremerella cremea]|uniref:hypothetical protein n=1 Tax=Bremerella cremea TaxID=1031537 RepID=UPI0031E5B1C7